jgi:transcriptional regulator with XRE-family HTH domain
MTELTRARHVAGISQRELARRAGVPQSTVGRIEAGLLDPRIGTVERLLRACGMELSVVPRPGVGVDRTQLRERLGLTPRQRIEAAAAAASGVARIRGRARRGA